MNVLEDLKYEYAVSCGSGVDGAARAKLNELCARHPEHAGELVSFAVDFALDMMIHPEEPGVSPLAPDESEASDE